MLKKTKKPKVSGEEKKSADEGEIIAVANDEAPQSAEEKVPDNPSKDGKKVLVIEDDSMLSSMYKMKLTDAGYQAVIANEGNAGLEAAKKEKPELILLDIMMPMMDGFAVLAELRKDSSLKETPVIIMTNLGTNDDIEKGKKLGATDYVVKADLTPAQIVEKIKKYL